MGLITACRPIPMDGACGDRNPVATLGGLINSEVAAP